MPWNIGLAGPQFTVYAGLVHISRFPFAGTEPLDSNILLAWLVRDAVKRLRHKLGGNAGSVNNTTAVIMVG